MPAGIHCETMPIRDEQGRRYIFLTPFGYSSYIEDQAVSPFSFPEAAVGLQVHIVGCNSCNYTTDQESIAVVTEVRGQNVMVVPADLRTNGDLCGEI